MYVKKWGALLETSFEAFQAGAKAKIDSGNPIWQKPGHRGKVLHTHGVKMEINGSHLTTGLGS